MNHSEKRRMEDLVDAVVVGMFDTNEDELFEALINRPHGKFCEIFPVDEFEKQKPVRRREIETALESRLDETGKRLLSQYSETIEDYWGGLGRSFFNVGLRLGRIMERQREAERTLSDLESKKRRNATSTAEVQS